MGLGHYRASVLAYRQDRCLRTLFKHFRALPFTTNLTMCTAMQESSRAEPRRRGAAGCVEHSPGCVPADPAAEVLDDRQLSARCAWTILKLM